MKLPVTFELWEDYHYDRETRTATLAKRRWQAFLHYDYHPDENGRGGFGETPSEALGNLFPEDTKDDNG